MREIKFRIWFPNCKKMMYLPNMYLCGEYTTLSFSAEQDSEYYGIMNFPEDRANYDEKVEKEIMQFTGLLDKNGKEIYEGDILKYLDSVGKVKIHRTGFVRFDRGTFEVGFHNGYGGEWEIINSSMEIIGNIYENPNFLNKQ